MNFTIIDKIEKYDENQKLDKKVLGWKNIPI